MPVFFFDLWGRSSSSGFPELLEAILTHLPVRLPTGAPHRFHPLLASVDAFVGTFKEGYFQICYMWMFTRRKMDLRKWLKKLNKMHPHPPSLARRRFLFPGGKTDVMNRLPKFNHLGISLGLVRVALASLWGQLDVTLG